MNDLHGAPRHEAQCALCGSFLPRPKDDENSVTCPKCGTVWESGKP